MAGCGGVEERVLLSLLVSAVLLPNPDRGGMTSMLKSRREKKGVTAWLRQRFFCPENTKVPAGQLPQSEFGFSEFESRSFDAKERRLQGSQKNADTTKEYSIASTCALAFRLQLSYYWVPWTIWKGHCTYREVYSRVSFS